jgi:asparagine synthase (glutamine-hydrolysing)
MHTFAATIGMKDLSIQKLSRAVERIGEEWRLDKGTMWSAESESGNVLAAGIHHASEASAQREYLARLERTLVAVDGLPLAGDGSFAGWEAAELARHWDSLPELLEGQFSVTRIDLVNDQIEVLLDPFGLVPLHLGHREGAIVISTSVSLIDQLLPREGIDKLAVSSFVALGWAVNKRTLISNIRVLPGGSLHTITSRGLSSTRHFGPAELVRARGRRRPTQALADELAGLVEEAAKVGSPIRCALTAGRDTRVMLALLRYTGVPASYYTHAEISDTDVAIASELASRFDLIHSVRLSEQEIGDWTTATSKFLTQTDGLSCLTQLLDYQAIDGRMPPLGITMWGVGGEIGRAGAGPLSKVSPSLPVVSRIYPVQERLLAMKIDDRGLLSDSGRALVGEYIRRFCAERRAEGWRTRELSEAFYTFERVATWGATGPRRASATSDVLSPYCTRSFVEYCFSLTPQERYLEAPHRDLLSVLDKTLLEHRFEHPFRAQRRRLAGLMAARELVETARKGRGGQHEGATPSQTRPSFQTRWLIQHQSHLAGLVEAADPELWELIDRERLVGLLGLEPSALADQTDAIMRAVTVLWFLAPT